MYTNPLVVFDGSPLSRQALLKGVEMAKRLHIPLHAIVAEEPAPVLAANLAERTRSREEAWAQDLTQEAMSIALASGVTIAIEVVEGDPSDAIGNAVERYASDILIVGSNPHSNFPDRISCSILSVR